MTERKIVIEILIPAYNASSTIRATLRSVQSQTIPLTRVTVVDDGSTDNTPDIVREFPNVLYIRNEQNLGMGKNLNRCFEISTGDLVCLLSADDLLAPEWHARCLEAAALCTDRLDYCIYLGAVWFAHCSRKPRGLFSFADHVKIYEPGRLLTALWDRCFYGITASACVVYPRHTLQHYGLYPIDEFPNMADVPYHWKLLTEVPFVYEPSYCTLIRTGAPGQISQGKTNEFARGALRAFRAALPSIASALNKDPRQVAAEYFFPYWLGHQMNTMLKKNPSLPPDVAEEVSAAIRNVGLSKMISIASQFIAEQFQRRYALWSHGRSASDLIAELDRCE